MSLTVGEFRKLLSDAELRNKFNELRQNTHCCIQWLVLVKAGEFFVDCNRGDDHGRGCGVKPEPAESLTYPPHVFDWLFKSVIPKHLNL